MKCLLISTLLLMSFFSNAQTLPDSFNQYMERHVGTWIADNTKYMSEEEPFDQYGIEWEYGLGQAYLKGKLFGLKDGEQKGVFWEFIQYWDSNEQKVVIQQIGTDGTVGIGHLDNHTTSENRLVQTFFQPDGDDFKTAHKTIIHDSNSHTDISYAVNEKDEWIEQRTYTWHRK